MLITERNKGKIYYITKVKEINMMNNLDVNNIKNMTIEEVTEKINEFSALKKQRELTEEEIIFRDGLRRRYLDNVKKNLRAQLEQVEIKKD